jgi:hypothetical protein
LGDRLAARVILADIAIDEATQRQPSASVIAATKNGENTTRTRGSGLDCGTVIECALRSTASTRRKARRWADRWLSGWV